MAERFFCNVGTNTAVSNYINSLRDKLKIKAGEVRRKFMISAKLDSTKWRFRINDRLIDINSVKVGIEIDEQHKNYDRNGYHNELNKFAKKTRLF